MSNSTNNQSEPEKVAQLFDAYYFAHSCGTPYQRNQDWMGLFDHISNHIVQRLAPQTMLDAGCAMGYLVEFLRDKGVEAFGVDISEYAINNVRSDIRPYCWVGSITNPFPQKYDLIVSIEVLEHLPAKEAEQALANLCQHTDDIIFSSSPFDYKEATHFHVNPPEYWAEQFALHGFFRDVDFDASFITPWAARFRRRQEPIHRLTREYERKFWLLWKENCDTRSLILDMRHTLTQHEQSVSSLKEEIEQLRKERDEWQALVKQYEAGRFIKFMQWIDKKKRSFLARRS